MTAVQQQLEGNTSRVARQSAVLLLVLAVGFVSIFNTYNARHFSSLGVWDVSVQLATQGRLPNSILHGVHAPRLETVFSRTVHWAMATALRVPVSLPFLARRTESLRERHVLSMLVDSGLEGRAPPQSLLF